MGKSRLSEETVLPSLFTASELTFIRKELLPGFGCVPCVTDGIQLRMWKSGQARGQPRVPAAVQAMCSRGLMRIVTCDSRIPRAFFSNSGLEALRLVLTDRRLFAPKCFDHLREQLGIDGGCDESAA
jgi:hypothetical protein